MYLSFIFLSRGIYKKKQEYFLFYIYFVFFFFYENRNNATETETKKKKKLKHNLLIPHTTQSLNELGRSAYLRGTFVKVCPAHVLNCTMGSMCASVHVIAEAHSPLLRPRKPICFRFTPVACISLHWWTVSPVLMRRAVMGADGMRCGWKAGKGVVCIRDSRECLRVLNVADRTGLEPSPGTRTSLQVTSKSGQCCQNDVTQTAY